MTINPLEHITKRLLENPQYVTEDRIELKIDYAEHNKDENIDFWHDVVVTNYKIYKKTKPHKKTYNIKIIGNIYDSQQSKK